MNIKQHTRESAAFQKLLGAVNTPSKSEEGSIITLTGTTPDTQKIILALLSEQTKRSYVHANIANHNVEAYLRSLKIIQEPTFSELKQRVDEYNLSRDQKTTQIGDYSISGDVITFWPSVYEHPIRASFWGEELESLELIDELYNKSIRNLEECALGDEALLEDEVEKQSLQLSIDNYQLSKSTILFGKKNDKLGDIHINFNFSYPPLYFKRLDILEQDIVNKLANGWDIGISTIHKDQLPELLKKLVIETKYTSGFENAEQKLLVLTDRELFGTIFIASEKAKSQKKINRYLAQLEGEIEVGDYVVHEDYGIATYRGIEQKTVLGKLSDYLILEYAENDTLSVPIEQVEKLTKYIGPDNVPPKITRLGKANWKSLKKRVKKSIMIMASELIQHYAKAELAKGLSLTEHEWEDTFAHEFEFEETKDQERAITEVLQDLSDDTPMNRLLVGDVGFGKTEVAIRAAFRAVMHGKQVAVLCPTTILVSQHFSVFKHRMRNHPIQIATLSRFGTRRENEKIVEKVNNGEIDIVIGTHRLLSNDIKYRKLGLIIVDEEQKFGVKQKETIKKFAYDSHVLSMSATPIPRTLSMALSNLRDISIITTPPPGRKAIKTIVESFSWDTAANAIRKEVQRGGQVYFLHNEVRTIESIRNKLQTLLPDIKFKTGHGQMHPLTLDKVMRDFYDHKFDVLVSTTIIENGIDIKNVNTIIINKAERFGLSQLYQLRGRVGRSKRQAYAYILHSHRRLSPDSKLSNELDEENRKKKKKPLEKVQARLEAIGDAQELGSGFKIASRDLEIRGAGNLLGKEQHGNISAIGLGLYSQLLGEEIERLKKLQEEKLLL